MKRQSAFQWIQAALVGGLCLQLGATSATAAGFSIPESSALGTALANAVVANPEETGAFSYNPSAMGFHDRTSVSLGALFIEPNFSVDTTTGHHESGGADWVVAPLFQAAFRAHDRWRIGLGISTPMGLETRWKTGTFPKLTGESPTTVAPGVTLSLPLGAHPTSSKLEIIAVTPTLAYKVNEDFSIAAGLNYYRTDSAQFDSQLNRMTGDGDGWGWNLSALYRQGALSFGGAYYSASTAKLKGHYTPLNSALIALETVQPGSGLRPAQAVKLDLELPWHLQLGVRYELSERLAVEFDWTRTGWSRFQQLTIKSRSTGETLLSDNNQWENSNAYRLGLTYDLLPRTQLRFGYAFDKTGQNKNHFSARAPDNDRHLFSLGLGQELEQDWRFEVGYMYVKFKDHDYRGNRIYTPVQDLATGVNGTDALDGDYEANAHLLALEITKTF